MGGFFRWLTLLLLAAAVFGGGGYYTYQLFVRPEVELEREKNAPASARPEIADSTLGEYQKCLETESAGDPLAALRKYQEFLLSYPDSSKAEEARFRLSALQMALLFTPKMTPGKQTYIVKPGDVLNKISHRLKVPPELLMAINRMENSNLRVGQRLYWIPADFSVILDRREGKIMVLHGGDFFAQYPIVSTVGSAKLGPLKKGAPASIQAKVHDKPGWKDGQRISSNDKGYRDSLQWIVLQPAGHTLYADPGESVEKIPKPSSGYGLTPEAVRELSALLRKNETVSIR